jgi:glycosyltransferase involved in cell wall biosynthesis
MRVLLAPHFFPPGHPGGTEAYTFNLARMLQRAGHEPFVICAEDWGSGDRWQPRHQDGVHEGIPVRRLFFNWEHAPDPWVNSYDNPATERHVERYLRELRPDVLHVTSCYSLGAGIFRAARRVGVPTFLTLTDFWFLCPRHTLRRSDGSLCAGPESAVGCQKCVAAEAPIYRALTSVLPPDLAARGLVELSRWPAIARRRGLRGWVGDTGARLAFLRRAFDSVELAFAPSRFLMETFVRHGFPADRIKLSPYGLETAWLDDVRPRDPSAPLVVGYAGQIEPIKGVDLLVRAFRSLPADRPIELRIHGDLSKNRQFGATLRQLVGDHPAIRLAGPFERAQLAEVMSGLDVLVVPSTWYENSPVVISEALAAGRPVIATDLGGIRDLVEHEVNGLLFELGDVAGLARQIGQFAADPALRERLRRGIRPVRTIDQEVVDLVAAYRAAAARTAA